VWPGTLRETEKEDTELSVLFRIITVRTPPVRHQTREKNLAATNFTRFLTENLLIWIPAFKAAMSASQAAQLEPLSEGVLEMALEWTVQQQLSAADVSSIDSPPAQDATSSCRLNEMDSPEAGRNQGASKWERRFLQMVSSPYPFDDLHLRLRVMVQK
jgi:hypothetical protein